MHIISFDSGKPGPALVVTGAVHGDERAGPESIQEFLSKWDKQLIAGRVSFVPVVNEAARAVNKRFVDIDLNRCMGEAYLTDLSEHQLVPQVRDLLSSHDVLLDLHSFRKGEGAFALFGPSNNQDGLEPFKHQEAETRLVASLGVKKVIHGWLGAYNRALAVFNRASGLSDDAFPAVAKSFGMTEYMRKTGGYACTLECGQHDAPDCIANGVNAIRAAMTELGLAHFENLSRVDEYECLELYDVLIKSHEDDGLVSDTINNFDVLPTNEPILRIGGKLFTLEEEGIIAMFPKVNAKVGESIISLARPSKRL